MRKVVSIGVAATLTAGLFAVGIAPAPVAAVNGQGWSALGSGIDNGTVFQIAKANDDTLYVGGSFVATGQSTGAGGTAGTNGIARFNPTTSAWTALGTGAAGAVYAVEYDPVANHVWIGGAFSNVNSLTPAQNRLARWNASIPDWISTPSVQTSGDGVEEIVVVASDQVYVGGQFTVAATASATGFAKYNGTNLIALGTGISGGLNRVNGMARVGNGVVIGGNFTFAGGTGVRHVAQWDGTVWSGFGGSTGGPDAPVVAAIASTSAGVVIGGNFASVQNGGTAVPNTNRLAMWNGTEWVSIGTVVGAVVEELQVIDNYLYAGGVFSSIGGVTANNIARISLANLASGNTSAWEALTDLCFNGVDGVVRTIVDAGNGAVYVGGNFENAGGVPAADRIAKFSPSTRGCPTGVPAPSVAAPENFRVIGAVPAQKGRLRGMNVHLDWDASAGYVLFNVTTRGRFTAGEFTETGNHSELTCWTVTTTCQIFFPFTSNDRTMAGRQYHQVIYTLQGYTLEGSSLTNSVGPLADLEPRPPSAPLNARAQAGWNNVTVTWDAPTSSGTGGFVMNYLVRSSRGNVCITRVTTIPETADARTCTFTNLRPGVRYTFTVEALSTFGWGATSEVSNRTTPYFLRVGEGERRGPWLSLLFGSRASWTGEAPGYAAGTPITAFYRVGTGRWERDSGARVRVDREGRFTYRRDFGVQFNGRPVSVRFAVGNTATCATSGPPCGESAVSTLNPLGR
jgi:hypothetical protein